VENKKRALESIRNGIPSTFLGSIINETLQNKRPQGLFFAYSRPFPGHRGYLAWLLVDHSHPYHLFDAGLYHDFTPYFAHKKASNFLN
jgi:hypothetical protein